MELNPRLLHQQPSRERDHHSLTTTSSPLPWANYMRSTISYNLSTTDGHMRVTVQPGPPAYVYVTHEGLTEGEVDAGLSELSWHIPAPCCVIVLPRHLTSGSHGH